MARSIYPPSILTFLDVPLIFLFTLTVHIATQPLPGLLLCLSFLSCQFLSLSSSFCCDEGYVCQVQSVRYVGAFIHDG